ncbi:hypothetical protein PG994_014008 [Apiospora phragmitis]|uniref:Uncharacterized protein n=1 Tax=Apiospora phragmitis TaxID=2905665 RepID=A0ABR1T4M9_9PEZI
MADERPRRASLKDHVNLAYNCLASGVANNYVEVLATEAMRRRAQNRASATCGGAGNNANTPFGLQVPSIGYAHMMRQESKPKVEKIFNAWGTGHNTWMGSPAILTAEDDRGLPEAVAKVQERLNYEWAEGKHPQEILNEHVKSQCWCGRCRPVLNRCEACREPNGIRALDRDSGMAQKRNPQT